MDARCRFSASRPWRDRGFGSASGLEAVAQEPRSSKRANPTLRCTASGALTRSRQTPFTRVAPQPAARVVRRQLEIGGERDAPAADALLVVAGRIFGRDPVEVSRARSMPETWRKVSSDIADAGGSSRVDCANTTGPMPTEQIAASATTGKACGCMARLRST
jgi:hypothetical protein